MIVRLNQIEVHYAEQYAGWGTRGPQGSIHYAWPNSVRAFEVLVLDHDEHRRPLDPQFRRAQIRQLIPEIIAALSGPEEHLVVRLDGPLAEAEMLAAVDYAANPSLCDRFGLSPVLKLKPEKQGPVASLRMQLTTAGWKSLSGDSRIGLERSVRMRAFAVPLEFINPLLDTGELDDERWRDILPRAGFVLSTVSGLESVYVLTSRFDAATAKSRLMSRLVAASREQQSTNV